MTNEHTPEHDNKPSEATKRPTQPLHTFTREEQVKGGKVKSPRKAAAARIANLKNGTRIAANSPNITALGLDSSTQRIAAPDVIERIQWLKQHYPAFYATSPEESADGIQKFFEEGLTEVLRLKSQGKNVAEQMRALGRDFILLHEMKFGKVNINRNVNINLTAFQEDYALFKDCVVTVLKREHPALLDKILSEMEERRKK